MASQALGTAMYAAAQNEAGAAGGAAEPTADTDDVVDAEIVDAEIVDDKDQQ